MIFDRYVIQCYNYQLSKYGGGEEKVSKCNSVDNKYHCWFGGVIYWYNACWLNAVTSDSGAIINEDHDITTAHVSDNKIWDWRAFQQFYLFY